MKKSLCCVILAILLTVICASACGEITHPVGPGQMGYDAVVISKTVTVRATQSANAKSVKKLSYGDRFAAVSLGNGWCECYLSETEGLSGYVLEDYILLDPAYITTEESTPVYAWQATNAKRIGLLDRGQTCPIIRMEGNWLLISLRGAAGWVVRPNGDMTGTARMKTSNVLKAAQTCFLSTNPWDDQGQITAERLKDYYIFVEFDASIREWLVTFDSRNNQEYKVTVNDDTGDAFSSDTVNG